MMQKRTLEAHEGLRVSAAVFSGGYLSACVILAASPSPFDWCLVAVLAGALLLYCALVDLRWRVVPDAAVAALLVLACADAALGAQDLSDFAGRVVARGAQGVLLAIPVLVAALAFERLRGAGMGGGDVKLIFAIGCLVGAVGGAVVLGLACLLALTGQIVRTFADHLCGCGELFLSRTMPFAPALAVAGWVVLVLYAL